MTNVNQKVGLKGLEPFFSPRSVAVIGATDKDGAAGRIILENLLVSGDRRKIFPVNPNHKETLNLKCYSSVKALPELPDLVVIITPAETVPGLVEDCGKSGIAAVTIISSGFKEIGQEGAIRENKIAEIARKYNIRVIGPNCMGTIRPSSMLNTSLIPRMPHSGYVAFLSQSGALGAGLLDWAIRRNMGFSAFMSMGSMVDVDFGDAIDYFGEDPETRSIIIYPESLGSVKKFISASRGFARTKPILVLKPGKCEESAKAVLSHTGSMVGTDLHYDAIFSRAGIVRVEEMRELFNGAAILDKVILPRGPNLAIITNGGGPAVLAVDNLINRGGALATLSTETMSNLDKCLPANWSRANPIDIREDADIERYINAVKVTAGDPSVDGLLVIYTPQGKADATDLAPEIIRLAGKTSKPLLMVWIGGESVADARQFFAENRFPSFEFPEEAVTTYLYMWQYARNLDMLYQTPEESPTTGASRNHLKSLISKVLRDGRIQLNAEDTARFLSTYQVPTTRPFIAGTQEEAVSLAVRIGYPVLLKVASDEIIHKTDVGGVSGRLSSAEEVKRAYKEITENLNKFKPKLKIDGISVHKFIDGYDHELIVGAKKDVICGPVIMFGLGGRETEFCKDFAIGLPPLNQMLARRILEQTRIYDVLLHGSRVWQAVNIKLLTDILVGVSNLIVDFPEILELDINPLAVSADKAIALDARIILDREIAENGIPEHGHLMISPYPTRYITPWVTKDGRQVVLRPIKPEDEGLERDALEGLSEEALRLRFFAVPRKITHEMLTRFCNVDYDREMVIIAEYNAPEKRRSVGNSRLFVETNGQTGEFAVYVADDFRNVGLGLKLMDTIIGIAREKNLTSIYGITMNENLSMINLARRLGAAISKYNEDEVRMDLEL
ncbi:MAG: bifunctional acetate--CoA ligase family protein/GNAT family N-acetyltransferase [Dehalococcoidales bacterium]|nr:bifunctional acetate--CoA ligase family protein/GNAT family N-acetyltransferase [Dehalococcoidales bacterium]